MQGQRAYGRAGGGNGADEAAQAHDSGTDQTNAGAVTVTEKLAQQRHNIIAAAAVNAQAAAQPGKTPSKEQDQNKAQNGAALTGLMETAQTTMPAGDAASTPQPDGQRAAAAIQTVATASVQSGTPGSVRGNATTLPGGSETTPASGRAESGTAAGPGADATSSHSSQLTLTGLTQPAQAIPTDLPTAAPLAHVNKASIGAAQALGTSASSATTAPQEAATEHAGKAIAPAGSESAAGTAGGKAGTAADIAQIVQQTTPSGMGDKGSGKNTSSNVISFTGVAAAHEAASQNVTPAASSAVTAISAALPASTSANAAGLAATVTAMHQAGQSGATLRLDPPGLGTLSVHVALGQQGQVNVLFVPSTQAASNALQNNLSGLGAALAQSGLTLGQAQVGGQFNQNAGQGGGQQGGGQGGAATANRFEAELPTTAQNGVNAYA
jgi:flagellar hook-length control protein FliK